MASIASRKDKILLSVLIEMHHNQDVIRRLFDGFVPFKVHGRDNLVGGGGGGGDSLYIVKKRARQREEVGAGVIYLTPHILFTHESGKTIVDLLCLLDKPKFSLVPPYVLRTRGFDGRSVEVYEGVGMEPLSLRRDPFPRLQTPMHDFVREIHLFFAKQYYLPYLIHPHRLLIDSSDRVLLLSGHLMHYIFSPCYESNQIRDKYFTRPLDEKEEENIDPEPFTLQTTRRLVLNFFYSLALTYVWLLNGGRGNLFDIRNSTIGFIRNGDRRWYDPNTIAKKKARYVEEEEDIITFRRCSIREGVCQGLAMNGSHSKHAIECIHTYVCQHLFKTAPRTLSKMCHTMREKKRKEILVEAIENEFTLFYNFINRLQNNNGDN